MKVFIWGSCVSRDCFNYPSSSSLELVKYHARCSCVSAMSNPVSLTGINIDAIASEFKRQAVIDDFQKQLLLDLETTEFDILLIDFIDERLALKIDDEGRVITVSAELQETGSVALDDSLVYVGNEKRFSLWHEAWNKFMEFCDRHGIKDKIVLNCVRWADHMENGEPVSQFTQSYIARHNAFLERIYEVVKKDIPESRHICYSDDFLVANSKHRWGISPFHYIDSLYEYTNHCLYGMYPVPASLRDRIYKSFVRYEFDEKKDDIARFISNGQQEKTSEGVLINFTEKDKYYYFRAILPTKIYGNGMAVTFRIMGWKEGYHYSLGYVHDGKQYKVNGKHLLDGQWYTIVCAKRDIVFSLDNPDAGNGKDLLQDIRFVFFGEFENKASIEIRDICVWEELENWDELLMLETHPIEERQVLLNKLANYIRDANPDADELYEHFVKDGSMPIHKINLPWKVEESYPEQFWEVGTFSWSWLCLHPVQLCTLRAYDKKDIGALCAAREFAAMWLDHFFRKEQSLPSEWHEHGTAERTISLLFLYLLGQEYDFDWRFMSRIKIAVILHARLLCSEAFYVRHQRIRFHNHGMFQDMALFLAGMVFAELPGAEYWRATGIGRLKDMLDAIYPCEEDFRISYENSFGYHCAGYTIIEKLARLTSFSSDGAYFMQEAKKIQAWADVLRYSTRQFPAFGDTFRGGTGERYQHKSRPDNAFYLMKKSGYAVIRGHHDDSFFTVVFIASSRSSTHKHCDNLSFTLYFDGIEWLIDPSFYNHEYAKGISKYLRSPEAHNMIYIPGMEYSIAPGLCQIDGKFDGNNFKLHGEHSCYEEISVKRSMDGQLDKLSLTITDCVRPPVPDMRMRLHCGEKIQAEVCPEGIHLSHPESRYQLFIRCAQPCTVLHSQQNSGIAGTGFCQYSEIVTLEFNCAEVNKIKWSIEAI